MGKQKIALKLSILIITIILLCLALYFIIYYNKINNLKFENRGNISRDIVVQNLHLDKFEKILNSNNDDKDIDNSNNSKEQNNEINETNINNGFNENQNINQEILVDNNQQDNFVNDNSHNNDSNQNITVDNSNNDKITNDNNSENQNTQIPANNDSEQNINNSKDIYDTMELCTEAGFQIGFKDTVDILSTYCESVVINGKVGYKLYIICQSGNCDKYK